MNPSNQLKSIHRLIWVALLAALTAVGAFIAIPMGPLSPVPVTLQTMFVLLAGLILGKRGGVLVILLYMAAGALGLPVFAGGKAGLAVFMGPTGGFLLGFLPAAFIAGFASGTLLKSIPYLLFICAVATAVTLMLGTLQLMLLLEVSLGKALLVGVLPFLPGGLFKCLAATAIYRFLVMRRLLIL